MQNIVQGDKSSVVGKGRIAGFLILACLAAVIILAWSCGLFARMPSDSALRSRFLANKQDFIRLVEMSNSDPRVTLIRPTFTHLDTDFSWPRRDIGLSKSRWDE